MMTDNNLLAFLREKSLLADSPIQNNNRNSSRSRQKRFEHTRQTPYNNHFSNTYHPPSPTKLETPLTNAGLGYRTSFQDVNRYSYQNNLQNTPGLNQGINNFNGLTKQNTGINQGISSLNGLIKENSYTQYNTQNVNLMNIDLTSRNSIKSQNYATSYQSARMETAQRLQAIAMRIRTEVNQLNLKIDMFGSQMAKYVYGEFSIIKQRIYQIVQETLRSSDDYVREFINIQQAKFTEEMLRARNGLQIMIDDIESMRQDINRHYWKNTAGVFITRQFETKVEEAIRNCEQVHVKQVNLQMENGQIREMAKRLYDNVREMLRRERQTIYGI